MNIRSATAADAASIAALSIEVWLGTYLRHGINAGFADYVLSEFTAQKTLAYLADPGETVLVSQNAEGIDGFIRVTTDQPAPLADGPSTEITTFYVQPRHHGKGRGKALLNAALHRCREQAIDSVWLATNAQNAPAIGFYLSQGFVQIGQTDFQLGGAVYPNNVYALSLR